VSVLRIKLRRDLLRRKAQVGAVMVTIALGVMLFGASFDAYRNLEASYRRTYDRLALADLTITGGDSRAIAERASTTSGVTAVATRSQADLPVRVRDQGLFGRVVGMPTSGPPAVDALEVTEGTYLSPDRPDGVIAEQHLADHFGLHPGDTVSVSTGSGFEQAELVGVAVSPEYLWPARSRQEIFTTPDDFGVLFVPEELARRWGEATGTPQVLIRYEEGADRSAVDRELSALARDAGTGDVMTRAQQPSNAALQEDVSGFGELSFLFPLLFLGAAGMATFMLLTRLVHAQQAQIGALEANGLARSTVLRHYLAYGVITGLAGSLVGAGLSIPLGRLITGAYTGSLSIPDTVIAFHPLTPVFGVLFGLAAGLLAAWAPARRALRTEPARAMRGDVPSPAGGRRSLAERVLPPVRRLPVRWRMALRGIGRNPRRSVSTVAGVVLALVLVLTSWGMVDTTEILLDRQFNRIDRQDTQVFFSRPITEEMVREAAGVPGVAAAEPVAQLQAVVAHGEQSYATVLSAFEADTGMHEFVTPHGATSSLPTAGVLVGEELQHLVGLDAGDAVAISLPAVGTSIDTTVAGFVAEPLGTAAYVATGELEDLIAGSDAAVGPEVLRQPTIGSVMQRVAPGADRDAVRAASARLPGAAVVVDSRTIYDTVQNLLGFFYAFVGVMLVFGAVMAFALIFNMTSVNIAERAVELATMRANGFGLGTIARLLTGENLLLTAAGIAVGLPVALWFAARFLGSFSSDLFQFDLQVRPSTLALVSAAMILVTLLSQLPGLRSVGRLDLGTVAREYSR
jgi:putative ABC transport system permease protein